MPDIDGVKVESREKDKNTLAFYSRWKIVLRIEDEDVYTPPMPKELQEFIALAIKNNWVEKFKQDCGVISKKRRL